MKKYTVVTHSRTFHVDEILAIVLLNKYLLKDDYKLIRTRDPKILDKHIKLENSFVIDVGYVYDIENKNFDHHQAGFSPSWENGVQFSSCGLIWKYLWNKTSLMNGVMSHNEKLNIEDNIIKNVDAQDNGVGFWDAGKFLLMFNRNHHDDNIIDTQFKRALNLASDYYDNYLNLLRNNNGKLSGLNVGGIIAITLVNKYLLSEKEKISDYNLDELKPYILAIGLDKKWSDGQNCGLCGIIWHYLWEKTTIMSMNMNNELRFEFENKFIRKVDFNVWKEGNHIKMYDKKTDSKKVLKAANYSFHNHLSSIKNEIVDNKEIRKDIKKSMDVDGIVVLSKNYKGASAKIVECCTKVLFIVPHSNGQWIIQSVPKSVKDLYSQKCPMPKSWGGLNDKKLSDVSGVKNMIFCHKGLFMCIFKGSKSGALNVANKILTLNNYDFAKKDYIKVGFEMTKSKPVFGGGVQGEIDRVKKNILESSDLDVIILNRKSNEHTVDILIETGKSIYIYPKGDSRWFICSIDPRNKFLPKGWKKLHGERLLEVSGIQSLCKCEKTLNTCIIKGDKDEALSVAKKLSDLFIK